MTVDEKLDLLLQQLGEVKDQVSGIKTTLNKVDKRTTALEMTIENEISSNIKLIAERHLDLSRKLNEAVHLASDIKAKQEIQDMYIKSHDIKLKIKEIS